MAASLCALLGPALVRDQTGAVIGGQGERLLWALKTTGQEAGFSSDLETKIIACGPKRCVPLGCPSVNHARTVLRWCHAWERRPLVAEALGAERMPRTITGTSSLRQSVAVNRAQSGATFLA
jgi:hypothetical protein